MKFNDLKYQIILKLCEIVRVLYSMNIASYYFTIAFLDPKDLLWGRVHFTRLIFLFDQFLVIESYFNTLFLFDGE
jgi:hypothetical protein